MGLERRGKRLYYYRKVREGGRVRSVYVGGGELGRLAAEVDRAAREAAREAAAVTRAEREGQLSLDREIDRVGDTVRSLVAAALVAAGYHTHKGQWRKRRQGGSGDRKET